MAYADSRTNSVPFDFYETPKYAVDKLLEVEKFEGTILEPCSGNGAISKVLEASGYQVISSDLRPEGIYGNGGVDIFSLEGIQANNLITNPPYGRKILDLVKHCLTLADQKICLLLRLAFLEAQSRYVFFKEENTLEKVYVFSKRVIMLKEGEPMTGSKMAFAWFIWNKQYKGKPFIDWLF
ncbi:MAG: hypothetical protein WCS33_00675 [Candidatus Caldatribacteriota bacterium]